jgi:site-specific DNA recombinase
MARQSDRLRRALDRLIDGYAEGLIAKHEFEPRIAEVRRRIARLDAQTAALRRAEEQTRSLQLVIGKLNVFAEMVHDRLETADWSVRREIVRTLVKRIEVDDDVVRVVFRVDPGPSGQPEPRRALPHCPTRGRQLACERHLRPAHAAPLRHLHGPALQR